MLQFQVMFNKLLQYREPRGFGFVKYRYAEDAAEAKLQMNHQLIGGREIRIVFAEENRKTPQEMRTTTRVRLGTFYSPLANGPITSCLCNWN